MAEKYWLAENGEVRCLDDRCPQECDMGCPIYLQTIALEYWQKEHFKEAAGYFEKTVKIEPTFAEAWNNLAACYGQMGDHQRAYEAYLKSFELLPKPKPLYGMAVASKNMGKFAQATQYTCMYERKFGSDDRINAIIEEISEKKKAAENKTQSRAQFVKKSVNGKVGLWDSNGRFMFCTTEESGSVEVFRTSKDRPIVTSYRSLADKILDDLDVYGLNSEDYQSIGKWHYDLVDSYIGLEVKDFADVVKKECLSGSDWTEAINKNDPRTMFFKSMLVDKDQIAAWIDKCTHMQLNAILHVYRALKSINIAVTVARLMESVIGSELNDKFEILAGFIENNSEFSALNAIRILKAFELYYGIHLKEEGDLFEDDIDVDESRFFVGQKISEELLIGRNFYLYEEGQRAKDQPKHFVPGDISIDCSSDEDEDEDAEDDYDALEAYVPEKCWIRRISALEDGQEAYLLIVVEVDKDYTITGVSCVHETVSQGGGGFFFFTPGLFGGSSESEYDELDSMPSKVFNELSYLVSGRALMPKFSLLDKPVPVWMRDHNEGESFALQSGYRSAYMHMSIESDADWLIESLEYSTYQSSNSAYGDMFTRPQTLSDREDEAVDMLLYIVDKYSDDEWKEIQ